MVLIHPDLRLELIADSVCPDDWQSEWYLKSIIDHGDVNQHCECGMAIRYEFIILNVLNLHTHVLGSVCIREILRSTQLFDYIASIDELIDSDRCYIPHGMISEAEAVLTEKELNFLCQIKRKRTLSSKQREWRDALLRKMKKYFFEQPLEMV